jgi:ABC-type phosphate transport system substrate-binding protein
MLAKLAFALIVSAASLLGRPSVARAQDEFVVIVNQGNSIMSLKRDAVSNLFMRKQSKWPNGQQVQPINLVESSSTRRRFSQALHGMDVPSVKSYWQEVVFSGHGEPPPERASDEAIIAYVKTNPNAIGYVSRGAAVGDVKVITLGP